MKKTIQFNPRINMFYFQNGDTMRDCTMIQLWNMGVREQTIINSLLDPDKEINLLEYAS